MQIYLLRGAAVCALTASLAFADFKYDQTTRMTGGAMMGMMQMAARFNKQVMQPTNSTIAIKGNRMVMDNGNHVTIYDLDKETITEINKEKKEHSVVTFAEMRAFMEKNLKQGPASDASITVDVKETGKTQTVEGMPTKEFLISMKMEATDPQSGKKGEMKFEMSSWLAPSVPGYKEVHEFHKRMAEKMATTGMLSGMAAQTGMGKGMALAVKKMAEMDGVPVLQITRLIPTDPEQVQQMQQAQQAMEAQQANQANQPSAGQAAEQAAGQAAAGAVAGRLGRLGGLGGIGGGGFGGLGRRKKQEQQQQAPAPEPAPAPAAPAAADPAKGSFSADVSMLEMTMNSKNFSNSDVDPAMFTIPAGSKLVKSPMQK